MSTELIKQLREATLASYIDCAKVLKAHHGDYEQALLELRAIGFKKAEKKSDRATEEGLVVIKQADKSVCAVMMKCETDFAAFTDGYKSLVHGIAELALANPTLANVGSMLAANLNGETVQEAIKGLSGKLGENIVLEDVVCYTSQANSLMEGYAHAGAIEGYGSMEGRLGVLLELNIGTMPHEAAQELAHHLALHIASVSPVYISQADVPQAVLDEQRREFAAMQDIANKPADIQEKILEGRLNKFYVKTCLLNQEYMDEKITIEQLLRRVSKQWETSVSIIRFTRLDIEV